MDWHNMTVARLGTLYLAHNLALSCRYHDIVQTVDVCATGAGSATEGTLASSFGQHIAGLCNIVRIAVEKHGTGRVSQGSVPFT